LFKIGVRLTSFIFAKSAQNLPIIAHQFGICGPKVLILGGVHGDETEGVIAASGLLESFLQSFPFRLQVCLVPTFNIDGVLAKTRTNSHGVDLNRNLPTKDWSPEIKTPRYHPGPSPLSEPENQGLVKYLSSHEPQFLLTLHSWFPVLNVNGNCLAQAEAIAAATNYKIDQDIGYPTPGCLGTYAGLERKTPVLTYEIERGLDTHSILSIHVPAILEALKATEKLG
jgi:murein peptide amidase A